MVFALQTQLSRSGGDDGQRGLHRPNHYHVLSAASCSEFERRWNWFSRLGWRSLRVAASHRAVREMKADGELNRVTKLRSSKYLNNLIEQDYRGVKSRLGPMLGFKRF